jgi:enoyl-[acyl-carrier-protein] reductase (NADH)
MQKPRVHWKKLLTRKILFMVGVASISSIATHFADLSLVHKTAELSLTALADHLLFGVPFEEVV